MNSLIKIPLGMCREAGYALPADGELEEIEDLSASSLMMDVNDTVGVRVLRDKNYQAGDPVFGIIFLPGRGETISDSATGTVTQKIDTVFASKSLGKGVRDSSINTDYKIRDTKLVIYWLGTYKNCWGTPPDQCGYFQADDLKIALQHMIDNYNLCGPDGKPILALSSQGGNGYSKLFLNGDEDMVRLSFHGGAELPFESGANTYETMDFSGKKMYYREGVNATFPSYSQNANTRAPGINDEEPGCVTVNGVSGFGHSEETWGKPFEVDKWEEDDGFLWWLNEELEGYGINE